MNAKFFPEQNAIHVWQMSLDIEPLPCQILIQLLSAEETERANAFRSAADRRRFIVARATLRLLLGTYLDRNPASLEFIYGAYGKPALKMLPNTTGLFFNLSHTADLAVYAVAATAPVGIDVEHITADFAMEEIAAVFLAQTEVAGLAKLPVDKRHTRLFQIWTRKEAYCKVRGYGLSQDLQEIDASDDTMASQEINPIVSSDASSTWFSIRVGGVPAREVRLHDLDLGADYAAAVAIKSEITPVIVHKGMVHQDLNIVGGPARYHALVDTSHPPSDAHM